MRIGFFYDFRPVGQGLFSIGRLTRIKDDGQSDLFTWVHDCGSATLTSTAMTKEIEALRNGEPRPTFDLLILSHFDEDHISGLIILLGTFRVRRLVLPYFTPAERALTILSQSERSALLDRFLAGPRAFIRSYEGGQETEIWFVRKSNGDPSPDSTGLETPPDTPVDLRGRDRPSREEMAADPDLLDTLKSGPASMLNGNVPLIIWGHWEFCFYNLPQPSVQLDALSHRIQPELENFFTQIQQSKNPEPLIRNMKAIYRDVFGSSAVGRNDISLVTYTGPALSKLMDAGIVGIPLSKLYLASEETRPLFNLHRTANKSEFAWSLSSGWVTDYANSNPSLLYTGDITLTLIGSTRSISYLLLLDGTQSTCCRCPITGHQVPGPLGWQQSFSTGTRFFHPLAVIPHTGTQEKKCSPT